MVRTRKRSVRGGGTVFLRKDGRYEAKLKMEETGRYKSFYGRTEQEALRKLQAAQFEQKQGVLATGPQQTVKQFLEYWFEDVHKPSVRLSTYVSDRSLIYKHLVPGLGHVKLQKLTGQHIQSFYAKKLKEGTSSSRVRQMQGLLHKALKHAKSIKLVGVNASEGLDLPKGEKYKPYVLTAEQARLLLERARERDLEALIALAVMTAMRKGEILALRWSDVDLDKGIVQVSRTLNYLAGYHFVEGKPKTETSERAIMVPRVVVDLLRQHQERQLEKKVEAGAKWVDRDLIFPSRTGNFLVPHTTFLYQFYRLLGDVGLPRIHFHDLRHSAATVLLGMGVPAHVVQELLGHSDVTITLGIYGHVVPSMRRDIVDRLDGLYGGRSE